MSKIVYKKYSCDSKNISTLFLVLFWLALFFIIFIIGVSDVFAATYDTFDVTWYYRETTDESNLLNVVKSQDTPFYKATDEYLNGFTTRIEHAFVKEFQYVINYRLQMYYDISQDSYFRSDTIDRIIKYSWVDSDFKLLNTLANQSEYTCQSSGICIRTFNISQQVLTLNNTTAIRFGVKTDNNISIGFYNSTQQVNYLMLDNISIEDNSNSTIIDQNNQIIAGQDEINNNISNSTNTITGTITDTESNINSNIQSSQDNINQNIDDMENAIVDSNNQTQEVIKDQFNSCRDSYNLLNFNDNNRESNGIIINVSNNIFNISGTPSASYSNITPNTSFSIPKGTYTFSISNSLPFNVVLRLTLSDSSRSDYTINSGSRSVTFTTSTSSTIYLFFVSGLSSSNTYNESFKIQLQKGSVATEWEPYGEQICTNKLDEQNETSKGIWATIKDLPNMFLDMLLGLFIPDDLSFIDNFKDVISNKLGFIASIPIQIIDFALGLVNVAFEEITTISFPSFEIFGVRFWNAEDIDITILLEKLKPFKYFTDLTCVILCCRTLYDMYHNFTGGGAN